MVAYYISSSRFLINMPSKCPTYPLGDYKTFNSFLYESSAMGLKG